LNDENVFANGYRTGKENITHTSWNPLYFVTLWIRQPVIGPPFPTILIISAIGGPWSPAPSGYATALTFLDRRHVVFSGSIIFCFGFFRWCPCMGCTVSYGGSSSNCKVFIKNSEIAIILEQYVVLIWVGIKASVEN